MRLATIRLGAGVTTAVRVDGDDAVDLGVPDVGALLRAPDWRDRAAGADGPRHLLADVSYGALIPQPSKVVCVGLNYGPHIEEVGLPLPAYPTLFGKFASTLTGPFDDIALPPESAQMDWEAELAVVVGGSVRRVDEQGARTAIAGYTVSNDVSAREWQTRTDQWMQGKNFEATTPLGPHLVTLDEAGDNHEIVCEVGGEIMQQASTADLVFGPSMLVSYISSIITLHPGDVILTGTPGGVGFARTPQRWLGDGEELVTRISGVGECRNICRR